MSTEFKTNVFICVSNLLGEIFTFEHCHPTGYLKHRIVIIIPRAFTSFLKKKLLLWSV